MTVVIAGCDGDTFTATEIPQLKPDVIPTLAGIQLSRGELSPEFNSLVFSYKSTLPNSADSISITPFLPSGAVIDVHINGNAADLENGNTVSLAEGDNVVSITLKKKNAVLRSYNLTITRETVANVNLTSLSLSTGELSPSFNTATTEYSASVTSDVMEMMLTANTEDPEASLTINGVVSQSGVESAPVSLIEGSNIINVAVTASDRVQQKIYRIVVVRAKDPANSAYLMSLSHSAGSLDQTFSSNLTYYSSTVANSVSSTSITATAMNSNAFISLNGATILSGVASTAQNLAVGDNLFTISVSASGNDTLNYVLVIKRLASANADLSDLNLSTGAISPIFSSATTTYTQTVSNSEASVAITAISAHADATLSINGSSISSGVASTSLALNVGDNIFNVQVLAQDKTVKTYSIVVTREGSSNADLSALSLSSGAFDQAFDPGTLAYTQTVLNAVNSTTVTASVADSAAALKVNNVSVPSGAASTPISLAEGQNTVNVTVVAQNGSIKNYFIVINRDLASQSSDATLADLSLSSGSLDTSFAPLSLNYTQTVTNATSSLTVTPTASDSNAVVEVNGSGVTSGTSSTSIPLSIGSNVISVPVKAQAGNIKTYTIVVNRLGSSDSSLSTLTFSTGGLTPIFNSSTLSYTHVVSNATTSLTVTPTVNDANAKVRVNDISLTSGSTSAPIALNVGENIVTVLVIAQDNSTSTYTIVVSRQGSSNADLSSLLASTGGFSPSFDSATTSYTQSVAFATTSVDITPTLADANASVTVNGFAVTSGGTKTVVLAVGVNVINVIAKAQDGTLKTYTMTITRAGNNNADLSALVLSTGAISPAFDSATLAYTQSVSNAVTNVDVIATLADTNATMTVESYAPSSGTTVSVPLLVGANIIDVTVTAEDGSTVKVYQVTITRAQSNNANLSNITLSSGALDQVFSSATTTYTHTVSNIQSTISAVAILEDGSASIKINGVSVASGQAKSISLVVGDNVVTFDVTAQDGTTTKAYMLTVTRLSNVGDLSNLTASTGPFDQAYDLSVHTFTQTVANTVTNVTITPTAMNSAASITVNSLPVLSGTASDPISLSVGSNVIDVDMIAQDGSLHKDVIVIDRLGSNNAQLSDLLLDSGAYTPVFSNTTFVYDQTVSSATTSVTVTPTVSAPTSTVSVNGVDVTSGTASAPINLKIGENTIYVLVSAQDGSKQLYRTTITRTGSTDNTLSALSASTGVFDQVFDAATLLYTQTVSNAVNNVSITPTVNDANATVTVNGITVTSGSASTAIALGIGDNVIPVAVTAQNGSNKVYTVEISRQGSLDADLASMSFSTGALTPVFDPATTAYTQLVSNATTSTDITPTVNDANAFVSINGAPVTSGTASTQTLNIGTTAFSVVATAQQGNTKTYTVNITRKSTNADLRNLVLSVGGMDQAFDANTTAYTRTVGFATTSLTVTPTVDDTNATLTVNSIGVSSGTASGAIGLGLGDNVITVVVTAQDGNTKTYSITVTRASNVATLSGLSTSSGAISPVFSSVTLAYTQTVANGITTTTVTPTATDSNATIEVNGVPVSSGSASGAIGLNIGENVITIAVRAQDNTLKSYSLVVRRLGSNDATLASLTASSGAFDQTFDPAVTTYTTTVPFTTTSATVTPTVNDLNATVKVNAVSVTSGTASAPMSLSLGDNIFSVSVTAQDGTLKTYTVIMTRSGSSNATLSNLVASTGVFLQAFSSGTTTYTQTVAETTTNVSLTPTVSDINATVAVNGTSVISGTASPSINLSIGTNIINTVVTAQDGSVKTYVVIIFRNGSGDATLSGLTASLGAFGQTFDPAVTVYTKTVTFGVTGTTITPTTTDANATVKVNDVGVVSGTASGNIGLAVGDNIISVIVTAADNSTKTYTVIITRNASNNADLSSLTITAGTLSPSFSSATTSYTATVSNATTSLNASATISDSGATMTINSIAKASGEILAVALNVGVNNINFVVTASDSSTRTYTVAVTRLSNNANLASLSVTGGAIDQTFDPALTSYTVTVGYLVNSLQVTATVEDTGVSSMTMNSVALSDGVVSSNLVSLAVGANTGAVSLMVTAQDGTTKTYTIDVARDDVSTFAQQAYAKANDAASANPGATSATYEALSAGSSMPLAAMKVAISGNYMVVGNRAAYGDQGIAYVYYRDPTTNNWSQQATLLGNNTEAGDHFGAAVAIDGDTIAIGAPKERGGIGGINAPDNNSNPASYAAGAVYVFQRSGTTWIHQAKLKEPDGNINIKFNEFGSSVAVSGNVVTVGVPLEESSSTVITDMNVSAAPIDKLAAESGAVYAFLRTGTTWAYEAHIKVSSGVGGDRWGHDIAMDGNTLAVSSILNNGGTGAVAVFVRDSLTATWTQQGGILTAPAPSSNDLFGWSVDINANTIVVGAPLEDTTAADSGAVMAYLRTGTTWAWQANIKSSVADAGDHFGKDVSLAGDTLVVGAPMEDSNAMGISGMPNTNDDINNPSSTAEHGAANIFIRSGTTWTQTAYIKAYNTGQTDKFGAAVAIDGDTVGIAAPLEDADHVSVSNPQPATDNDLRSNSGAVYIFK
ncbi:MAG: cadherin-like beta sandwich domain-containing protein [Gammaproteobacteria bacterium]|nr:cadherin-like beta sandwich domain-containing protein [Gammaproteobacteria bacterium]